MPTPTPSLEIPLTDIKPYGYRSCLKYALDKRPGLERLHKDWAHATGPADYIDRGQASLIDADAAMEVGYAIVWPRNHRDLNGQDRVAGYCKNDHCGHIAIIVAVDGDQIKLSEAAWNRPNKWVPRSSLNGLYMIPRLPGEGEPQISNISGRSDRPI